MPNPRKPNELLKRQGTYRKDRHAVTSGALAVAIDPVSPLPHEMSPKDAFAQVMEDGVVWLGRTDAPALAMLQSMLDERGDLRDAAINGSTEARKHLRELDKQIISLLSELGFNPAARARLGLAEVKTQSKLEELRAKQR